MLVAEKMRVEELFFIREMSWTKQGLQDDGEDRGGRMAF